MIPEQLRGARALLGWSQSETATRAGVAPISVLKLETGQIVSEKLSLALRTALEDAGVVFIDHDRLVGVALRKGEA